VLSARVKVKYLLLFGIFNFTLYFSIQYFITTGSYDLLTPFDNAIPLIPEFIWVYHSFIPIIVLSLLTMVKSRNLFLSTLSSFAFATLLLSMFFVLVPAHYPRDQWAVSAHSASTWLVVATRWIDGAGNCLPSGHNTFAWMLMLFMQHSFAAKKYNWVKPLYVFWALLISISTLTLKQHYIVDVLSGIAMAYFCYAFTQKFVTPRLIQNN
jgi:membrane-associated phospholipid phosphatase